MAVLIGRLTGGARRASLHGVENLWERGRFGPTSMSRARPFIPAAGEGRPACQPVRPFLMVPHFPLRLLDARPRPAHAPCPQRHGCLGRVRRLRPPGTDRGVGAPQSLQHVGELAGAAELCRLGEQSLRPPGVDVALLGVGRCGLPFLQGTPGRGQLAHLAGQQGQDADRVLALLQHLA
jgi:hypothetical protein